jgi:hypothetical protein
MNAHKIVILELAKAEAIIKVQNQAGLKAFLTKEIELLGDFVELYHFYSIFYYFLDREEFRYSCIAQ